MPVGQKREHSKTICIDFDGVIHRYDSGWQGADEIPDLPVDGAIEGLHKLCDDPEIEVAVHSARSAQPGGITAMKEWLEYWEGVWREESHIAPADGTWLTERCQFPRNKPAAMVYIDDRGINFDGDWSKITTELKDYQPWNRRD